MNHISLFSGEGGFDLAAHWMGWNNIAHCEINPFCRHMLSYYWPGAASHSDIKTTDFSIYNGTVDIISGGFPCQPYSTAGLRKGKEDDRHLWPEMLRAIRESSPRWVVGEMMGFPPGWTLIPFLVVKKSIKQQQESLEDGELSQSKLTETQ